MRDFLKRWWNRNGWIRIRTANARVAGAVAGAIYRTEIKSAEILARAAREQKTRELYDAILKTAHEDRTRWLAADVNDVHAADNDALIFGELFLNEVYPFLPTDMLRDRADQFREMMLKARRP